MPPPLPPASSRFTCRCPAPTSAVVCPPRTSGSGASHRPHLEHHRLVLPEELGPDVLVVPRRWRIGALAVTPPAVRGLAPFRRRVRDASRALAAVRLARPLLAGVRVLRLGLTAHTAQLAAARGWCLLCCVRQRQGLELVRRHAAVLACDDRRPPPGTAAGP